MAVPAKKGNDCTSQRAECLPVLSTACSSSASLGGGCPSLTDHWRGVCTKGLYFTLLNREKIKKILILPKDRTHVLCTLIARAGRFSAFCIWAYLK